MSTDDNKFSGFTVGGFTKMTVPLPHRQAGDDMLIKKSDWDRTLGIVYEGLMDTKSFGENSAVDRAYDIAQDDDWLAGQKIRLLAYGLVRTARADSIDGEPTYKLYGAGVWALVRFANELREELNGPDATLKEREYFKKFFEQVEVSTLGSRLKQKFTRAAKPAKDDGEKDVSVQITIRQKKSPTP